MLMLPRPITFVMAECREPNAFYSSDRAEVVMCYETMQVLLDRGQQLAKDQELRRRLRAEVPRRQPAFRRCCTRPAMR